MFTQQKHDPLIGKKIADRYEIVELSGRGGFGSVYKTTDLNLSRIVALKLLHSDYLENEKISASFKHEAQISSRIIHPHVVRVFDHNIRKELQLAYIAMDYVPRSLSQVISKENGLGIERSIHILLQLCSGMAAAHKEHVVHRDLKPSNILLANNEGDPDFIKITDFGIARVIQESEELKQYTKTGINEVKGTSPYMSPEQCEQKALDVRSDIYSMGCVFFEILTGCPPYTKDSDIVIRYKHVHGKIPHLVLNCGPLIIRLRLDKIIHKALAKNPDDRYQSVDHLKTDLESVQHLFSSLTSRKANMVLVGIEIIWLFMFLAVKDLQELLFMSKFISKYIVGLNVKLWTAICLTFLAIVLATAAVMLFGSPTKSDVSDRELPLVPIIDPSVNLPADSTSDALWREIHNQSTPQTDTLNNALNKLVSLGKLNKSIGYYDRADLVYSRAEDVAQKLNLNKSFRLADILNSHAESYLLANTVISTPNEIQRNQQQELLKKYGKFISSQILRENGLIYATNAATARDTTLRAMTVMRDLSILESQNNDILAQTLLAQGLLAESFLELGDVDEAKNNYDYCYSRLLDNNSLQQLEGTQSIFLLISAGRFYLQQNNFAKAFELINRLPPRLSLLGSAAQYDLAAIYNDLGLIKEREGEAKEAENFFSQAHELLMNCPQNTAVNKKKVLGNLALSALKAGDFKSALQFKLKELAKM